MRLGEVPTGVPSPQWRVQVITIQVTWGRLMVVTSKVACSCWETALGSVEGLAGLAPSVRSGRACSHAHARRAGRR